MNELGETTCFDHHSATTEDEILSLENNMGYSLLIEFRQALKELSSHINN